MGTNRINTGSFASRQVIRARQTRDLAKSFAASDRWTCSRNRDSLHVPDAPSPPTSVSWRRGRIVTRLCVALAAGAILAALPMSNVSSENTLDRIQAGQWVVASMYWEDKLVSTGKSFNPIGWHAAHKTLPIGTLVRISNPKNHRSINVTINDRGPFVANRDLDLTLGASALLGVQGLGTVYMEVLSIPPVKHMGRPVVESLFA